jgi:hypothetical protein
MRCLRLRLFIPVLVLLCLRPVIADDWIAFSPADEEFRADNVIDLRHLNESVAGANGQVTARDGAFFLGDGERVRFWGVNGPSSSAKTIEQLRHEARLLAGRGVNLVRFHGRVFDDNGEPDPERVRHVQNVVEAMRHEGIYTHLSIYFPLWFQPKADLEWLPGYDGNQHPFGALFFNEAFQQKYRDWWRALLLTPNPDSGRRLVDEPAVLGAEMINEDSYFFWTFSEQNLPEPQLRMIEGQFADWLIEHHGSLESARQHWNGSTLPRDDFAERRVALRPLWNIANEKTARDRDTARFLFESQTAFYRETYAHLRELGFEGLIHASNWTTASDAVLGPLEKLSYTVGDFMDRHGYFGGVHQGDNSAWSIRENHLISHRSALRFDPQRPGGPRVFEHPVMDPQYDELPSMISETTWTRPNRFRGEAPLYYAAYGALQDGDAIVHFAFDGSGWNVKPNFWMQPWTLMSPALMGQFPATALIYRKGLVATGGVVATINLNREKLLNLGGTPLPQGASLDELRLADVPVGTAVEEGGVVDPLVHYAGRVQVNFTDDTPGVSWGDVEGLIDRASRTVRSTTGELRLDYDRGVLEINASQVRAVSGRLNSVERFELGDVSIESSMEPGHIVLVSLDGRPVVESERLLLQVMSEERATGYASEPADDGLFRITDIGRDPWRFKPLAGTVRFERPDAAELKVTALDFNGSPVKPVDFSGTLELLPDTIYYLVEKP